MQQIEHSPFLISFVDEPQQVTQQDQLNAELLRTVAQLTLEVKQLKGESVNEA